MPAPSDQIANETHGRRNAPPPPPAESTEPKVKQTFIWGTGRRKSAVARVRIAPGTGKIEINGRTLNDYFTVERDRKAIFGPLEVTNTGGKMDVLVNTTGGGTTGQSRRDRHGPRPRPGQVRQGAWKPPFARPASSPATAA